MQSIIYRKVDLLKIDVEGAEFDIIHDLIESRKIRFIEQFIIEYHPQLVALPVETFVAKLEHAGFRCSTRRDTLHVGATEIIVRAKRVRGG